MISAKVTLSSIPLKLVQCNSDERQVIDFHVYKDTLHIVQSNNTMSHSTSALFHLNTTYDRKSQTPIQSTKPLLANNLLAMLPSHEDN